MTLNYKHISIGAIFTLVAIALFAVGFGVVRANPMSFFTATPSASATSTLVYVAAGATGTTTPLDAYAFGGSWSMDKVAFLLQSVASSTAATTTINFQYSNGINCLANPNGCDWYQDEYFSSNNGAVATTSTIIGLGTAIGYSFPAANTATTSRIMDVPTPTRYVRAIFSVVGAQSGFWYTWQPVRQNP